MMSMSMPQEVAVAAEELEISDVSENCRARYSRCGVNGGQDLGPCCPGLECVKSRDGYGNARRRCE